MTKRLELCYVIILVNSILQEKRIFKIKLSPHSNHMKLKINRINGKSGRNNKNKTGYGMMKV